MAHNFPETALLGEEAAAGLLDELVPLGISGGAVYDALIGATARQHRRPLASRGARAQPIYEAIGVETEVIR